MNLIKFFALVLVCACSNMVAAQSECYSIEDEIIVNNSNRNITPQVSCDGERIVWRGNDGTSNLIFMTNCEGEPSLISTETVININPQISADGTTVVWSGFETIIDPDNPSNVSLGKQNIYYYTDAEGQVEIESDADNNNNPVVCANGENIIWKGNIEGVDHIFKFTKSTGVTRQISTIQSTRNATPQISADCSIITWMGFDNTTNRYQIFMYDNGVVTNISAPDQSVKSFAQVMSSDGQVIAWIGIDQNNYDQIYKYVDGQVIKVTDNMPGSHRNPFISMDGSMISWSNYQKDVNGSGLVTIYTYANEEVNQLGSYAVSSEFKTFLSTSLSETGNSVVWIDPSDQVHIYNYTTNESKVVATDVRLYQRSLVISCDERAIVWAEYVNDYHTTINRTICGETLCPGSPGEGPGVDVGGGDPPVDPGEGPITPEDPDNPGNPVVTPPEVNTIPTMGEWGLISLALLFLIFGVQVIKSKEMELAPEKF